MKKEIIQFAKILEDERAITLPKLAFCGNASLALKNSPRFKHLQGQFDDFVFLQDLYNIFEGWDKFSGDVVYPVPAPTYALECVASQYVTKHQVAHLFYAYRNNLAWYTPRDKFECEPAPGTPEHKSLILEAFSSAVKKFSPVVIGETCFESIYEAGENRVDITNPLWGDDEYGQLRWSLVKYIANSEV